MRPYAVLRRKAFLNARGILAVLFFLAIVSYHAGDQSLNTAASHPTQNLLGPPGAYLADIFVQSLGFGASIIAFWVLVTNLKITIAPIRFPRRRRSLRSVIQFGLVLALIGAFGSLRTGADPVEDPYVGGFWGQLINYLVMVPIKIIHLPFPELLGSLILLLVAWIFAKKLWKLLLGKVKRYNPRVISIIPRDRYTWGLAPDMPKFQLPRGRRDLILTVEQSRAKGRWIRRLKTSTRRRKRGETGKEEQN